MGSYMIIDIEFKDREDRFRFEDHLTRGSFKHEQLTDYHVKDCPDDDLSMERVVYYIGYVGYAEPEEILDECLKKKINIKFMAWLPISDTNEHIKWTKIRGRW